jgi:hypothetical protein
MSNRRHKSRFAVKHKSGGANLSDRSPSEEALRPKGTPGAGDSSGFHPLKPSTLQKTLLAAAVGLEIVWILFLVILAVTR